MFRWIFVAIAAVMLVCASLQPAVACEQAGAAHSGVASGAAVGAAVGADAGADAGADDGQSSATPEPGIDMPELITGPAAWPLADGASPVPVEPASRLAPAPYLGTLLRPPCA